jgi:hypothetical protein
MLINFRSSLELRKRETVRKNDLIDIMLDALKDFQVGNTIKQINILKMFLKQVYYQYG